MVSNFLKEVKEQYESQQPYEIVEIIEKQVRGKESVKFKVKNYEGKSLVLFSVSYKELEFPCDLVTNDNDYICKDINELDKEVKKVIEDRLTLIHTYYSQKEKR